MKQKQTIRTTRTKVKTILKKISNQEDSSGVSNIILSIIERENNWIYWKKGQCQPFDKKPSWDDEIEEESPKKKNKSSDPSSSSSKAKIRMGKAEITKLWNLPSNKESIEINTLNIPTVKEMTDPIKMQMDPENGIEEQYKHIHDNIYTWRCLRLLKENELSRFVSLDKSVNNLESVLSGVKVGEKRTLDNTKVVKGNNNENNEPPLKKAKTNLNPNAKSFTPTTPKK
eukprot:TRINITY_DN5089_c0_g1_i1.p1 TRINITY_DN5089_c0_g1~~TRINITY_DN5089_c0_g1_i1.p1  ORF type:complete len:235 (-),score=79.88 TRINITY_DN5089_c0_g1_i1:84-767(-)